ncbi:hypothetical protein Dimus_030772, partial [Dionaea muscipula]
MTPAARRNRAGTAATRSAQCRIARRWRICEWMRRHGAVGATCSRRHRPSMAAASAASSSCSDEQLARMRGARE